LLFSTVCLAFIFFSSLPLLVILFSLYGVSIAAIDANQRAYVADLAIKNRATALGAFYTLLGLLTLLSSIIAGILWQINPAFTFLYGFILSLTSVLVFILTNENER